MRSCWRLGWLLSVSIGLPSPALGQSTIKVVPKEKDPPARAAPEKKEERKKPPPDEPEGRPETPAPLPGPTAPPPAGVVPTQGPPPAKVGPLPWVGLVASGGAMVAGTILLANAASTLNDPDNFEILVDDDGDSVQVEVSERFEDSQKSVLINGLTGTLLLSVGITGTVISLIEIID